jgi:hypothetical protein
MAGHPGVRDTHQEDRAMQERRIDPDSPVVIQVHKGRNDWCTVQATKRLHGQAIGQTIGQDTESRALSLAEDAAALLRFAGVPVEFEKSPCDYGETTTVCARPLGHEAPHVMKRR